MKFVRVRAGVDEQYAAHLEGVKRLYAEAFPFNLPYLEKIDGYVRGVNPAGTEMAGRPVTVIAQHTPIQSR